MWITLDFRFLNRLLREALKVPEFLIEEISRGMLIEWRQSAHLLRFGSFSHNSSLLVFSIRESKSLNPDEAFARFYGPKVHLLPKVPTSPNTVDRSDSIHLIGFEIAGLEVLMRNREIKKVEERRNLNRA